MTVPPIPGVRYLAAALLERATGVDPDRALAIAADVLGRRGREVATAESGRDLAAEMLELAAAEPPGVAIGLGGRLEPAEPGVDMSRPDDHGILRHRHP